MSGVASKRGALTVVGEHTHDQARDRPDRDASPREMLEYLYRRHRTLAFRVALRYGRGDATWAEDRVQDVFVALSPRVTKVLELDNPAGWIYRATTNRCLNRLRWERIRNAEPVRWLLGQRVGPSPDPEQTLLLDERLRSVFDALDRMPPKERACFLMYHVDGKTQTEIAAILGHSVGYASKLIKRVEARLTQLERKEEEDGT